MAKELTGCGKFLVWVLPTAIAASVGYFVLGPRVGGAGIGDKVPVIRSLGQELAKKIKGSDGTEKSRTPKSKGSGRTQAPAPSEGASDGATEFQRIREGERPSRSRRGPVDEIE